MNGEMGMKAGHSRAAGRLGQSLVIIGALGFGLMMASAITRATQDAARKIGEGKKLYHERCSYCHLAGGTGAIMLARRLGKDRSLLEERTDLNPEYVRKITRVGINGMPPHNRIEVPDNELDLIATYLTRPASARTPVAAKGKGGTP